MIRPNSEIISPPLLQSSGVMQEVLLSMALVNPQAIAGQRVELPNPLQDVLL